MPKQPKPPKKPDPALALDCPKCGAAAGVKCKNYLGKGKAICQERKASERVKHACPRCGALAGKPCTNFKGEARDADGWQTTFCQERGRPEITAKKLARKADDLNARKLKEYGGDNTLLTDFYGGADALLAAEGVEKATAEKLAAAQARAHTFKEHCGHAEHALTEAFNWITMREIRRVAAGLIGAEWEAKLWAYCERTFKNSVSYYRSTYCNALRTTNELALEREMRFDPARATVAFPDGRHMVTVCAWPPAGYVPVMTWEVFRDRFPWHTLHVESPKGLVEPDDGGLFASTIGGAEAGRRVTANSYSEATNMKCVSLHNPWAHAVMHLGKTVENRTWATRHRGPLLIHAAATLKTLDTQDPVFWRRVYGADLPARSSLTFGAILGLVDVIGCVQVGPGGDLGEFGRSNRAQSGCYAWVLDNPRPLAEPIPYRGLQQLFDVPDAILPVELRAA